MLLVTQVPCRGLPSSVGHCQRAHPGGVGACWGLAAPQGLDLLLGIWTTRGPSLMQGMRLLLNGQKLEHTGRPCLLSYNQLL